VENKKRSGGSEDERTRGEEKKRIVNVWEGGQKKKEVKNAGGEWSGKSKPRMGQRQAGGNCKVSGRGRKRLPAFDKKRQKKTKTEEKKKRKPEEDETGFKENHVEVREEQENSSGAVKARLLGTLSH